MIDRVERFLSLSFDGVLAGCEREAVTRELASCGARATSWNDAAAHTYALVGCVADSDLTAARARGGRLHDPALVVVRIVPGDAWTAGPLWSALGGAGRLAGVVEARFDGPGIVVDLDRTITPLSVLVASVDAVAPRRRIEPVLPLDDETLTELCAAALGEPDLDTSRLIETYIEPMLISS